MQELRLVAVSEDGTYLVMATVGRGTRFTLPIDDRLRAAVRGNFSRLGQYEIEVESPLRPKEIQARIRAGETAEEIAEAAGIPLERVRWFEGPVLQEREFIAQQALRVGVRRAGESTPGPALGDLVGERLGHRAVDPEEAEWDSWKCDDGTWRVRLSYIKDGVHHTAHWVYDQRRRHVTAYDDDAARLVSDDPAAFDQDDSTPMATVTPFVPRLATPPPSEPPARAPEAPVSATPPPAPAPVQAPTPASPPAPAPPATPSPAPAAGPSPEPVPRQAAEPPAAHAPEPEPVPEPGPAPQAPAAPGAQASPEPQAAEPAAAKPADQLAAERVAAEPTAAEPTAAEPVPEPETDPATAAPAARQETGSGTQTEIPAETDRPAARPAQDDAPAARQAEVETAAARTAEAETPAARPAKPKQQRSARRGGRREMPAAEPAPEGGQAEPPAASGDTAPAAPQRRPKKSGRGRRASVPSWDEIMFGTRKPD